MWEVLTDVAANLGMGFENIVLITVMLAGMIAYAKGFQIGIITHFVFTGCVFMWFYASGLQYGTVLSVFLMVFVIMCLSIYAMAKQSPSGGLT